MLGKTMRPKKPEPSSHDLFRSSLEAILDSGTNYPSDRTDRLESLRRCVRAVLPRPQGSVWLAHPAHGRAASYQAHEGALGRGTLCGLGGKSVFPGLLRRDAFPAPVAFRPSFDAALAQADRGRRDGALAGRDALGGGADRRSKRAATVADHRGHDRSDQSCSAPDRQPSVASRYRMAEPAGEAPRGEAASVVFQADAAGRARGLAASQWSRSQARPALAAKDAHLAWSPDAGYPPQDRRNVNAGAKIPKSAGVKFQCERYLNRDFCWLQGRGITAIPPTSFL